MVLKWENGGLIGFSWDLIGFKWSFKGFHKWRYPKIDDLYWKILSKWMI